MKYRVLKQTLVFCSSLLFWLPLTPSFADSQLPDIGTAAVSSLSIEQEVQFGNAFMRFSRASLPIIDDPVLDEYINDLGMRLVSQANNVRFPFTFFIIRDNTINAAAFLGGKVKVNSGLFSYADNESELAGVMAHEISHVTQRHIARYLEDQRKSQPLSIAGLVGSIALAMINPTAGIAALNTTVGLTMQNSINFTRENEEEADRIGMALLYNAGFDPHGMVTFFQTLSAESRYSTQVPPMLLNHPLTSARVAEAQNRANNYPARHVKSSLNFYLAKARIAALYSSKDPEGLLADFTTQLGKAAANSFSWQAANYGKALVLMQQNKFAEAKPILSALYAKQTQNLFINDSMTDLQIALHEYQPAIDRLRTMYQSMPDNAVVLLNLANVYLKSGQATESIRLLDQYTRDNPDAVVAWDLLTDAYQQTNNSAGLHQAAAESLALKGQLDQAEDHLHIARANTADALSQARIDARIAELEQEKQTDKSMKL